MHTPTQEQAKTILQTLIQRYHTLEHPELQSEANVRANFIDPLFEALGWPINNPVFYNREEFVRGVGFADIALKTDPTAEEPLIFVESKRLGGIEPLNRVQDRRNREVAYLRLQLPGMSVDRTREEQQAINYAYQKGMHWAILTNFEHLRLFNARRDTLVLNFDGPSDLLNRFEELWQLAFEEVKRGSLDGLRGHRERLDIDEEYLRLVNVWRLRLGQDILSHRENQLVLQNPQTREWDVYKLREVVQRILDRLVVIRYAEDRLVIRADQLRTLVELLERSDYGVPLLDQIRYFFQKFNVQHNGALFADHICDRVTVSEDVLKAIIINLYDARFRAMSADIMGNTYEQYLGQTLEIHKGEIRAVDNLETRKSQGSYYTPEYVVRYIVDQTLGKFLYGTENGRFDGTPLPNHTRKKLEDIDGSNGQPPLTILDPSCGSGSFLMYAYQVLETFYQAEIKRITAEKDHQLQQLTNQKIDPFDLQIALAGYKQRLDHLKGYQNQILERHLYGVDLDPQAAELAAVNLMLRAIARDTRLPLILNQNIKVGNSLLSSLPTDRETTRHLLAPFAPQLAELRRLRLTQQGVLKENGHPLELQGQFERLAAQVNQELNNTLTDFFAAGTDEKRPFNWAIEFPELFVDANGHLLPDGGFTIVMGNPPYLSIDDTWGQQSAEAAHLRHAFADIWAGKSDIYYYFFQRGLSLLQPNGRLGFITARYYLEAFYAQKLRQAILQQTTIQQIIDFADYTVFARVGTKSCITLLQHQPDPQTRAQHHLLADRAAHRRIDVQQFLAAFPHTAYPFQQAALTEDSWNLYGQTVASLIAQIDANTRPLGELCFIGQGMQTGKNPVFVVDADTLTRFRIEPALVRKNIKNQDIHRYNLAFRGLYLIYPETIENLDEYPHTQTYLESHRPTLQDRAAFKRGDCDWWRFTWPLHKEKYHLPKIVTPFIAPENRFALDASGSYIGLTDTYAIFPTAESPDLRYLLALLNSKLLTFRFRYIGKAKDYRYEYVENGLAKIPIHVAPPDAQQTLATLAQRLLDLNFVRQTIYDEFADLLQATIHTQRPFYTAYYDHSEYRGTFVRRAGTADANTRGVVTHITIDEADPHLVIRITEAEAGGKPLITLEIPHPAVRRFLLLGIRAHLLANDRKQQWAKGRLLQTTLQAIMVPVLVEAAAAANVNKIEQLMAELEQQVWRKLQQTLAERASTIVLDLGRLEAEMAALEQKIDTFVFALYGIADKQTVQLINDMLDQATAARSSS